MSVPNGRSSARGPKEKKEGEQRVDPTLLYALVQWVETWHEVVRTIGAQCAEAGSDKDTVDCEKATPLSRAISSGDGFSSRPGR
jgi:hypothetical protein